MYAFNSIPIYLYGMRESFGPPKSNEPITAPGYELRPCLINMVQINPSQEKVTKTHTYIYKNSSTHVHACALLACVIRLLDGSFFRFP